MSSDPYRDTELTDAEAEQLEKMRAKHTALPWEVSNWRICAMNVPNGCKVICDTANNKATRTEENAANAAFIVRAVNAHYEMVAACQAIADAAAQANSCEQLGGLVSARLGAIHAAIAKATGGTE